MVLKRPSEILVFLVMYKIHFTKTIIWNSIINFITKLKVKQRVQSSLQLTQLHWWDILKSNFIVSALFKYKELLAEYIKENWNRFLDDYYTVSRGSQISPEELLLTLHSINPLIQFTMEYSKAQIQFLDILIKRNQNGI